MPHKFETWNDNNCDDDEAEWTVGIVEKRNRKGRPIMFVPIAEKCTKPIALWIIAALNDYKGPEPALTGLVMITMLR